MKQELILKHLNVWNVFFLDGKIYLKVNYGASADGKDKYMNDIIRREIPDVSLPY